MLLDGVQTRMSFHAYIYKIVNTKVSYTAVLFGDVFLLTDFSFYSFIVCFNIYLIFCYLSLSFVPCRL